MDVYLDNNASTRLAPEALDAMLPYLRDQYGNASSAHSRGREAKKALDRSRETLARVLGASQAECICFTGSGTEAINLAIKGAASARRGKGNHIVTSAVEHPAVLNTCKAIRPLGYEVTYVKPDSTGRVAAGSVAEALRADTILVSIMHANNETGTINPIREIGKIAKERNVLFHIDAVQSFCRLPVTVDDLHVDLLSISAHKVHGPKGVGALYIREGVTIHPLVHGGRHEGNLRAGTENVAGIAGMGEAVRLSWPALERNGRRMKALRDRLEHGLRERVTGVTLNGHPDARLPNTVNLSFENIEAQACILELDRRGVAVSSGSACTSGSGKPSHVLLAMGIPCEACRGSLRFSLGTLTTDEEIDYVLEIVPDVVSKLRAASAAATA